MNFFQKKNKRENTSAKIEAPEIVVPNVPGLTRRDYILTQVLKGIMSNPNTENVTVDYVVNNAIRIGDNLISKLDKRKK